MERVEVLDCSDPELEKKKMEEFARTFSNSRDPVSVDVMSSSIVSRLRAFNINDANAFDPNEEFKLRQIIHEVGTDRLYSSLRAIADVMECSQNNIF
jgi:hypothetical protein